MKNWMFISTYSHGTSFSEIVESIKLLNNNSSYDIISVGWKERLNPGITKDNFLDAEQDIFDYYENFWKILNKSDEFQKILFIDFFSPWLDILQYLLEAKWKKIKLWALLHGWSFLPRDLYKWNRLKYSEELWFDIVAGGLLLLSLKPENLFWIVGWILILCGFIWLIIVRIKIWWNNK